jgi:predicted DNA-binding protein with PD1-like motif
MASNESARNELTPSVRAQEEHAMKSKLVWENAGERTFVLILDPGEEAFAAISDFAAKSKLAGASLTALGAFERATVGWFDLARKTYKPIEIGSQCEALSLIGDIATGDDGKPSLHLHAVLGLSDGTTRGGHFMKGIVRPTLEVTIVETPTHLRRKKKPELGIALIELA